MEAIWSSETSSCLTRSTWRHIPEGDILNCYRREKCLWTWQLTRWVGVICESYCLLIYEASVSETSVHKWSIILHRILYGITVNDHNKTCPALLIWKSRHRIWEALTFHHISNQLGIEHNPHISFIEIYRNNNVREGWIHFAWRLLFSSSFNMWNFLLWGVYISALLLSFAVRFTVHSSNFILYVTCFSAYF
jgi:hypothetical protein